MKRLALITALLTSAAAHAYTVSVTKTNTGDIALMNLNGDIGQSFFNAPDYNGLFMGDGLVYAASDQSEGGGHLAPGATSAYIATEPNASQVLIVGGTQTSFAMELFTLDAYNSITFDINGPDINTNANITFTGSQLAALAGVSPDGSSTVWATFTGLPRFTGIEFDTSQIAEEFIPGTVVGTTGGAPEASTWAMLITGFAGLWYASSRQRRELSHVALWRRA